MAGYTFIQRTLPKTFSQPALHVYNTPAHLLLQSKKGWLIFELIGPQAEICARICVNIKNKIATSPARAPFGSCEIYAKVNATTVEKFLRYVDETVHKKGVKQFVIKDKPVLYEATQAKHLYKVLVHKLKFTTMQDVSSIISVSKTPLYAQMKISERQKAVKASKLFSFNICTSVEYKRVYDFIYTCRKERNQTLSLSWRELKRTLSGLPNRFLFFNLTDEKNIVAAAIVIRVSETIWYTFYYAHVSTYNKVSPVVYLLSCIYDCAAKEKVKLFDLGTSMLHTSVNKSLLHFKQSVGAKTTAKHTFIKNY